MREHATRKLLLTTALLLFAVSASPAWCQSRKKRTSATAKAKQPETQLELELITGNGGVNRTAQLWSKVFEDLKVAVRIRRGTFRDKPGVTEKNFGTAVRRITIIAEIDARGRLILPGRIFSMSDGDKLADWLRELRTYGAQGSPEGKQAWGLSKKQLETVLVPLRLPLTIDPQGKDLLSAMVLFAPNKEQGDLALYVTPEAKRVMGEPQSRELFPQSLIGMSKGTALAIVLRYYGLCFQPNRTPAGNLELAVRELKTTKSPWTIGWPFPDGILRNRVAPKLYKSVKIDLEQLPLLDVIEAASAAIEMPILLDHAEMKVWNIVPSEIRVSHPPKRTTWSLAIKRTVFTARLKRELLVDEGGKPFVWITPIQFKSGPKSVKKRRR